MKENEGKWRADNGNDNDNESGREQRRWTLKTSHWILCMYVHFSLLNIMRCIQIDCCACVVSQPLLAFSSAGILFYHSKSHFTWPKNAIKQSGRCFFVQFILLPSRQRIARGWYFLYSTKCPAKQKWPFPGVWFIFAHWYGQWHMICRIQRAQIHSVLEQTSLARIMLLMVIDTMKWKQPHKSIYLLIWILILLLNL